MIQTSIKLRLIVVDIKIDLFVSKPIDKQNSMRTGRGSFAKQTKYK